METDERIIFVPDVYIIESVKRDEYLNRKWEIESSGKR